ncbi:MAG: branched-chain alpha-keto acid dehydrogenase subunit E2, partial [Tateyamaria sp.]|nr:branched-chain alpha-keto acid dehydrogenase subunit E2 [Tateyamaria sp.]
MWRSVASNAANFLIVALFLMAGIIIWGKAQYTSPGPAAQAFCL